ncbi:MAG: hypothetical protein HRU18_06325 [Pseudoalteromonas sp.]|uniref:hypothetical protein n=1 Tax=Pseudoalteromonas sp. TaxID=53249 RepID=UPI001D590B8D|nr:hypothetical protein [Pseudoalteromonas sp.]NRA77806.1 hypothetical protein [Pseudoalteromonas sp.]
MPMLTPSQVHIDVPLTNLTVAYAQEMTNFIADKVFGTVSVDKQSDKYYIYDREGLRHGDVKVLAPRTEVNRVGMSISNDSYFADVRGLGMDFDEQTIANTDTALEFRSQGANVLIEKIMIDREVRWADTFFKAGVWGTETTPANLWSDYAASTPIVDVTNARRAMQLKSGGYKPNVMVVGKEVRDILVNHPDILGRLNGGATVTNTALITDAKLAEIFEVEQFLVMEAVYNDVPEGAADNFEFIGGKHAMLAYKPSSMGLKTPASGAIFTWDSIPNVSGLGITVESFSDDALKRQQVAEMIQVKCSDDMKVIGADLGYFFDSVVA